MGLSCTEFQEKFLWAPDSVVEAWLWCVASAARQHASRWPWLAAVAQRFNENADQMQGCKGVDLAEFATDDERREVLTRLIEDTSGLIQERDWRALPDVCKSVLSVPNPTFPDRVANYGRAIVLMLRGEAPWDRRAYMGADGKFDT